MSQPTKEQWVEITEEMDRLFTGVCLRCDGYLLTPVMERYKNQLAITIYINGISKGKWVLPPRSGLEEDMSDIQRRFCNLTWRNKFPRKLITNIEKIIGKRKAKKEGYYDKIMSIKSWWTSAKRLVNHLKKHNQNIEVLTYEEYKIALNALPQKDKA